MENSFTENIGIIKKIKLKNSNNSEYWIGKISKNIKRDDKINKELSYLGWTVIRFLGKDILKHTDECVKYIEEVIFELMLEKNYIDEPYPPEE